MKNENALRDEQLTQASGGFGTDSIPHIGVIKACYIQGGANLAFTLGIYYVPSPMMAEVVEEVEREIASGNTGYTVDGVYYDGVTSNFNLHDLRPDTQ